MNEKQIWQTIALDLKRAANYMWQDSEAKAKYYLDEAQSLFKTQKVVGLLKNIKPYIKFTGDPEDILLGSSLISTRI